MIKQVKTIELPKISDERGNLTFIEGIQHVPFQIKRIYYLYDIPDGKTRGGHAHKNLEQLIIAVNGSFHVQTDNGKLKSSIFLDSPSMGLYIPPMTWREMQNFSSGAVCLVLASDCYDEQDYFRNYQEFKKAI